MFILLVKRSVVKKHIYIRSGLTRFIKLIHGLVDLEAALTGVPEKSRLFYI